MKPFERAFRALVLSLAFAALGSVPRAAHANPPAYTLTDIVTLPGGTSSSSAGVSPSGQVTGGANTSDSSSHAFLSAPNGGAPKDLGTLPGSFYSTGFGVNASGQVAGGATVGPSLGFYLDTPKHAFLSGPHGGALQDLGTLPGGSGSLGYAVNDRGEVAGYSDVAGGVGHAFLSAPNGGALKDLGTLPGGDFSGGHGVNASGQVVGQATTASGSYHAFLSGPDGGALQDLGTLPGGNFSDGSAVNASGQVTGRSGTADGYYHAFLSGPNGGALQDLGTLPGDVRSKGFAVNVSGQVVGLSQSRNGETRAFLYSGGVMIDLDALVTPGSAFARLYLATGITDSGIIIGDGATTGFDIGVIAQNNAFLLTPILGGPKITVTASASAANGTGQRTITLTTTNTGGASANTLQITAVTLGGAAPVPPSSVPTTPSTLLNTPGMNTQTNGFVFKPLPGTRVAVLHVVGRYTDPNNQITGTFVATIRLPLP